MKPGTKPLPTKIKELRGGKNTYHRKPNKKEPQPETSDKVPKAPSYLSKVAQAEWRRMAKLLHPIGLLTKVDEVALSVYCVYFDSFVKASEQVAKYGTMIKSPKTGVPMQSPSWSIMNKAGANLHKWAVEFGMTPSSRSNVQATEKKKNDPLSEFMDRGGKPFSVK